MNRFGEKLRYSRTKQELTVREFAPLMGISSYSYISAIETGRKKPSLEFVIRVADIFGILVDQLVRDDQEVD